MILELAADTIRLEPGVTVSDVVVRTAISGRAVFEPETVRVRSGDVVRFVAADRHLHAIAFDAGQLSAEAARFLEQTNQLKGPPLLTEGASWIVSLAAAPPGVYPFVDLSHGARGTVIVDPSPTPRR